MNILTSHMEWWIVFHLAVTILYTVGLVLGVAYEITQAWKGKR